MKTKDIIENLKIILDIYEKSLDAKTKEHLKIGVSMANGSLADLIKSLQS